MGRGGRRRGMMLAAVVAGLLAAPAAARNWGILDVSGTYETTMALLEPANSASPVVGTVDLDETERFEITWLEPGLHYVYSGDHHRPTRIDAAEQVALLIHGVDEPGPNWDTALRLLARDSRTLVFFFVWTKWNRPHSVEYWIGHDLAQLARVYSGKVERLQVVAHSAGGVLLLQSLCLPESSRLCAYDPAAHHDLEVRFHTIASPLGGFGMRATSMASALAGAVTAHVGSEITYYDVIPQIDLSVWFTSYETDGVLEKQHGRDMRFPQFAGEAPAVVTRPLPDCTHDSAIREGIQQIFGIAGPEQPPTDGPWKLIYRDEAENPAAEAAREDRGWRQVPR